MSEDQTDKNDPGDTRNYPPIGDYAFISDCHSVALISKTASIDWCCMPRIDSSSCFGRILDRQNGGYCRIWPTVPHKTERHYCQNTLVLETIFHTDKGKAKLSDCFTMREGGEHNPHRQILRIIEGLEGEVEFQCVVEPRFDYGVIKPWIRNLSDNRLSAIGGCDGLLICGDMPFERTGRHSCRAVCTVRKGERLHLSILHRAPEALDESLEDIPDEKELDDRLEETVQWWQHWSSRSNYSGIYAEHAQFSALVLKGLCNAPTGAIAAAATTSLPEEINGVRNWDYRFSWIRDSVFTLRSLNELGYNNEADGFRRFVERSAAGSAEEIQILYGVGGERRLREITIDNLDGYRGTKPVRIGNSAVDQEQFDIYGELLDLSWRWHQLGNSPDEDYWEFITELTNRAIDIWKRPDCGLWEFRSDPRHFVLSKAMCWVAVDRAIRLAEDLKHDYPKNRWQKAHMDIRDSIMKNGVDAKRGVFIQAYDHPISDASLLLLPVFGFVAFDDKVMMNTTEVIRKDLHEDGLIRRYPSGSDGLDGGEGSFVACTFWLVECLAAQGRIDEAMQYYESAVATANDLGLFSEEFDTGNREMLGNFPQGLTHLSHIAAIVAINRAKKGNK